MRRDTKIFLAQLIGAMTFTLTVLAVGCYYNAQPDVESLRYVQPDKTEIVRLQPKAMAEATYQINAEMERRFKP